MTPDECRALQRLADVPRGIAETLMLAHGFTPELIAGLVLAGLATVVTDTARIGGQTIKAGRVLILLLGSANHDERQFVDPERFDVTRKPNPHVSFGGGVHHCLGAALARLEASIALSRLLRFAVFEPAGRPVRRLSPGFRSYVTVPIHVNPA